MRPSYGVSGPSPEDISEKATNTRLEPSNGQPESAYSSTEITLPKAAWGSTYTGNTSALQASLAALCSTCTAFGSSRV